MAITLNLSPEDTELVKSQAAAQNMTAEEFSRAAVIKAARNAAYVENIRRAKKNADAGHCTYLTNEELRKIVYGS